MKSDLNQTKEMLWSKVIAFLRFPLMIGVVVVHCRFTDRLQPQLLDNITNGGGYDYISWLFSKVVCGLCVPVFFLISGFLYFKEGILTPHLYATKMKKRLKSIVIPFLLWNIIYAITWAFGEYTTIKDETGEIIGIVPWNSAFSGNIMKDIYLWFTGLLVNFNGSNSPVNVPFWYLRDLICMFILSPFIYWFVKYTKHYGFLLLVLGWVLLGKYSAFPFTLLVIRMRPAILFFLMGAYFAINKKNMVEEIIKVGTWIYWVYGIVAILDLQTKDIGWNCYLHRITILIGIVVVFKIGMAVVLHKKKPETFFIKKMRTNIFFMYAFHWLLLYWIAFPLSKLVVPDSDISLIITYFTQIILCCFLSVVLGTLLYKTCPQLMKVLNGR